MKKIIGSKKVELETRGPHRSGRIRSRRSMAAQNLSAECAALTYDTEEEEESFSMDTSITENEEGSNTDMQDVSRAGPLWELFNAVKKHRGQGSVMMAEPFMRLPNKRCVCYYVA